MMGLGPKFRAPNSPSSASSTQAGRVCRGEGIVGGGGKGSQTAVDSHKVLYHLQNTSLYYLRYNFHFTSGEAGAQRGSVSCPRSHSC